MLKSVYSPKGQKFNGIQNSTVKCIHGISLFIIHSLGKNNDIIVRHTFIDKHSMNQFNCTPKSYSNS